MPAAKHTATRRRGTRRALAVLLIAGPALVLGGCSDMSAMDPESSQSETIADLWWILLAIGGAVFVIVVVALVTALFRRRGENAEVDRRDPLRLLLVTGAAIPFVILVAMMFVNVGALSSLAMDEDDEEDALVIEVIGHRWWWEVRYPQQDFATANEIHIPAGETVRLDMWSADVIHSLWVPQLAGKLDLLPDQVNTLWISSANPGEYLGQCAEFCGLQHANMRLSITADEPGDFDEWIARQQEPAPQPEDEVLVEGQQVFLGSACVYCHTIEGTGASGQVGPDLTHLASRETLAAGTIENNTANLAAWIVDPQSLKHGSLMPPTQMEGASLTALVAYLETLE